MRSRTLIVLVGLTMVLLFSVHMADAAICTRVVDRADDEPSATACTAAPNDCSLRGALSGAVAGSLVCVPDGTYSISGGELSAAVNLTMRGGGAASTFVKPATGQTIRVLHVQSGATVTVENMTIQHGTASSDNGGCIRNDGNLSLSGVNVESCKVTGSYGGGGIYTASGTSLTLSSCQVRFNEAHGGGGIDSDGNIHVTDSRIESNTATASYGGGLSLRGFNTARIEDTVIMGNYSNHSGGGLFLNFPSLDMLRCEVSYNIAQGNGGGLYAGTSSIWATNTTFSGNHAHGSGGGLYGNRFYWDSHLSFCTITGNFADSEADGTGDGGGIYANLINFSDSLELKGTVVAKNNDMSPSPGVKIQNIAVSGAYADHLQSLGRNFIGANDGAEAAFPAGFPNANGDYVGSSAADLDPALASLADNGGPTRTHATLPGSSLVNRGPVPCTDADDNPVGEDQRGEPRPIGRADIGAFEGDFAGVNPGMNMLLLLE
jgi:hypothetical protein